MDQKKKVVKKTSKKSSIENLKIDFLYFLPIILAIAVVPLIVYMKILTLSGIQKDLWTGDAQVADFFSYYKHIWVIMAGVISILSLAIKKMNNDLTLKKTYTYIPLCVYAFFVLLSTVLSQYNDVAANGFVDRYEGVYVLLSYVALLFVTLNLVNAENHVKYIVAVLVISATVIGLIGLSEFLKIDFFSSSIGKHLILPPAYQNVADKLQFKFPDSVYSTLYNPDYVGSYVALAVPVFLGIFLYAKKAIKKILLALLICLMCVCLVGSKSMAGIIGLAAALVLMAFFFRKAIIRHIKLAGIVCVALLILITGTNYLTGGGVSNRVRDLLSNPTTGQASGEAYVEDIQSKNNGIYIMTDKQSLSMRIENGPLNFYGSNNKKLVLKQDGDFLGFKDPNYSLFKFTKPNQGIINFYIGSKTFKIAITNSSLKLVGTYGKIINSPQHPEKIGFYKQESALSARGFIWSRTVPLLKETLFIGHGPDTYIIYFPQDDVAGKLNAYNTSDMIVDKPHNIYLQMAMNTGMPSALAFVALFLMYAVSSFRKYFRSKFSGYGDFIGVSVFCAISGYCVTGLANDSVVSVAPVFWVLLGLGLAVNKGILVSKEISVNKATASNKATSSNKKAKAGE